MSNTTILRMNGYSVDADGSIICARESVTHKRYAHEQVAIIRIDAGDSKAVRELHTQVIAVCDEPRALCGIRGGSLIIVFRCDGPPNSVEPSDARGWPQAVREIVIDGKAATLVTGSRSRSFDPSEFEWRGKRSPFTVKRDELPPLHIELSQSVVDSLPVGGTTNEQDDVYEHDMAAARVRVAAMQSEEEQHAADDEAFLKEHENMSGYAIGTVVAAQVTAAFERIKARLRRKREAA
jgi:hypothetical protein